MRIPEAIVVTANADPALAALVPGKFWFGQADDSALAHPAYGELVMIGPESRQLIKRIGRRPKEIVTTPWGVSIYALDPLDAEKARDAWYGRFMPDPQRPPPQVDDGEDLAWWCLRGFHAQDNDQFSAEGGAVYVRVVAMATRHSVDHDSPEV